MSTIQVKDLTGRAEVIIRALAEVGDRVLIVENGRPLAMLVVLTEEEMEDYILANDPEFVEGMRLAEEGPQEL